MFGLVNSRNATIRRVASFPTCGSYLSLFLMCDLNSGTTQLNHIIITHPLNFTCSQLNTLLKTLLHSQHKVLQWKYSQWKRMIINDCDGMPVRHSRKNIPNNDKEQKIPHCQALDYKHSAHDNS